MKIKSVRIENFRSFRDETISVNPYSCFVGPNGAGKSTILTALNVLFREQANSVTDPTKLADEDYFCRDTSMPARITATFCDLSEEAKADLADYVRQDELVVTAEACFDDNSRCGVVKHFGQRLGMEPFCPFFDAAKRGDAAAVLAGIYDELRSKYKDLPPARSKDERAAALRAFEATHPGDCVLIPSEDNFYGFNSTGKLAKYVQWVYVPAVKDALDEQQDSKNTALGKLISRTIRSRLNLEGELADLKADTVTKYQEHLDRQKVVLGELSTSLQRTLADWAHPDVRLELQWVSDPNKAVVLQPPVAGIRTGEGSFVGSISRMGHGLQRSYLLALLHELAGADANGAPTLILGCEEPELYQHPPQARHLAEVFSSLADANNQILVTTHSPYFVRGNGFESVRLVRRTGSPSASVVRWLTFEAMRQRIQSAMATDKYRDVSGMVAKIHQALRPVLAEMFFAGIPVLVEGPEDVSYITTVLHRNDIWSDFRRLGCHLVPVNGKNQLVQPLAMAIELGIPVFVVFDADGDVCDEGRRNGHKIHNRALFSLLGSDAGPFPQATVWGDNYAIWPTNLADVVKGDLSTGVHTRLTNQARAHYGFEQGLNKDDLFIAEWLSAAYESGYKTASMDNLCDKILGFARKKAGV